MEDSDIVIIDIAKELIEEFQNLYVWFPINRGTQEFEIMGRIYTWSDKGFEVERFGITETLGEMSMLDATILVRSMPEVMKKIKEVRQQ